MKKNIVFLDRATIPKHINIPQPTQAHHWQSFDDTPPADVLARAQQAHVIITNKVAIDAKVMDACPDLELIVAAATGTNNIDLSACQQRNIAVYNVRHYADQGVPEHALTLMLALLKNLLPYCQDVTTGRWQQSRHFCFTDYPIENLAGKTLGIVGAGALGQKMAHIASALEMKVLLAEHKGQVTIRPGRTAFGDVLKQADIISLHCPLTPTTQGLMSEPEFEQMKPSAYLINTARGPLVDEQSLANAVLNGQIAGAASDVASVEPLQASNPLVTLLAHPNFILTPHIAWASEQSLHALSQQLRKNIDDFYQGHQGNRVV